MSVAHCDGHSNETATGVCLNHHVFLCTECLINNTHKEQNCEMSDIKKLDDRGKTIVSILATKQELEDKANKLKELETSVTKEKDRLTERVENDYVNVLKKVDEGKHIILNAVKGLENAKKKKIQSGVDKMEKYREYLKTAIDNAQTGDLATVQIGMDDIRRKLQMPEAIGLDEYIFVPSSQLEGIVKGKFTMGQVLKSQSVYEDPKTDDDDDSDEETPQVKPSGQTTSDSEKPPSLPPKPSKPSEKAETYVGSETADDNSTSAGDSPDKKKVPTPDATDQGAVKEKPKTDSQPTTEKKQKKFSLFGKRSKTVSKNEQQEEVVYGDTSYFSQEQTVQLSPDDKYPNGASIGKFVITKDKQYMAFIDATDSRIIYADMEGSFKSEWRVENPLEITAMDGPKVAVLSGEESIDLTIYNPEKGEPTKMSTDISYKDITGLDYSIAHKEFALSSVLKVSLINSQGKVKKTLGTGEKAITGDVSLVLTRYDFSKKRLYILKCMPDRKSIKCCSLDSRTNNWAKNCQEEEFWPRAMFLFKDQLVFLCRKSIMKMSTADGYFLPPPLQIRSLPDESLGMALAPDGTTAVVTNKSRNKRNSLLLVVATL